MSFLLSSHSSFVLIVFSHLILPVFCIFFFISSLFLPFCLLLQFLLLFLSFSFSFYTSLLVPVCFNVISRRSSFSFHSSTISPSCSLHRHSSSKSEGGTRGSPHKLNWPCLVERALLLLLACNFAAFFFPIYFTTLSLSPSV